MLDWFQIVFPDSSGFRLLQFGNIRHWRSTFFRVLVHSGIGFRTGISTDVFLNQTNSLWDWVNTFLTFHIKPLVTKRELGLIINTKKPIFYTYMYFLGVLNSHDPIILILYISNKWVKPIRILGQAQRESTWCCIDIKCMVSTTLQNSFSLTFPWLSKRK